METFQKRYFQHSLKAAWKLCVMMRQLSISIINTKLDNELFTINNLFANDTQYEKKNKCFDLKVAIVQLVFRRSLDLDNYFANLAKR